MNLFFDLRLTRSSVDFLVKSYYSGKRLAKAQPVPQCPESSLGISAIFSHFLLFTQSHPFLQARTVISWVRVSACFFCRVAFHAPLGDWALQTGANTGLLLPSQSEFWFGFSGECFNVEFYLH